MRSEPVTTCVRCARVLLLALAALSGGALIWGEAASAQPPRPSSGAFVLQQDTVNSTGEPSSSPTYLLAGSLAQEATVGRSISPSYALESGFWTSLSTLSILRVEAIGTGAGTLTASGIACSVAGAAASGDCIESVVDGTVVEVVASPAPMSSFDGWSGCDVTTTTTLPGDTCEVTLRDSRTVTAGFTLLATVGDRVWLDYDGDGLQDAGEPGVDGVDVTLSDGAAVAATTTTTADGSYGFMDVPPGTYTVSVDPGTLPVGTVPTYDLDGVATPHEAVVTLTDGEMQTDVDFGFEPMADLAITKTASTDTVPSDGRFRYTLVIENLGPARATGVVATDVLPPGLTPVGTTGCAGDPMGIPTCTIGTLDPGEVVVIEIEVRTDPRDQPITSNTAGVAAVETDPNGANDAGTAVVGAAPVVEVPVAGPFGLALLALLLAAAGLALTRRG